MEEINLLEYSTYNVELIRKNQELFDMLFNKISRTYQLFNVHSYSESNKRNVSFAPTAGRISNVFIIVRPNGEFEFTFRGDHNKMESIKGNHETCKFIHDTSLTIKGITHDNYLQHLPTIVKAIEYCSYSFI